MPAQLTYPGVYVEEVPSGVRTITGVATSITAFVGRSARGPVADPVTVTSYADFERTFGGLWKKSRLAFSVRDFFLNGGSIAVIVRLYRDDAVGDTNSTAALTQDDLEVEAASPGTWSTKLRIRVDYDTRLPEKDLGELPDPTQDPDLETNSALFNLSVFDGSTGATEVFRNVTVLTDHPRNVTKVVAAGSALVRVTSVGVDRPDAHTVLPPAGKTVFEDDTTSTGVTDPDKLTDGLALTKATFDDTSSPKQGLYALDDADLFNLLVIPPHTSEVGEESDVDPDLVAVAVPYCEKRRAMYIADTPADWTTVKSVTDGFASGFDSEIGTVSKNAALFFPRAKQPNPLMDDQIETFSPTGAVAGVFARTDAQRGVWKAPAGQDATLSGVAALDVLLSDGDIGQLNPIGVNCLRALTGVGRVVWGARTMQGADRLASEWKYIPVRRTALYIEESLFRGTQWVVFEPNDEPLWAQIRLNVGTFMDNLFRQGAFQGSTPKEAYFVKCDKDTTTQADINLGIVNIHVGFAPLKPAEFVVIRLQQMAGASAV
jgi:phage tail sheath protein FI